MYFFANHFSDKHIILHNLSPLVNILLTPERYTIINYIVHYTFLLILKILWIPIEENIIRHLAVSKVPLQGKFLYLIKISNHLSFWNYRCIENWFSLEDKRRFTTSINHISTVDAYNRILQELSSIEDRFYHEFDARRHKRQPREYDWKEFAVPRKFDFYSINMKFYTFHC